MKRQIAVFFGGESPEYEVSMQSATAVIQAIDVNKNDIILIGITKQGKWCLYEGSIEGIIKNNWEQHPSCTVVSPIMDKSESGVYIHRALSVETCKIDVAIPVLHGKNGEDGTIQGVFELAGINYVGCGVFTSALCTDKVQVQKLVHHLGIPITPSIHFERDQIPHQLIREFIATNGFPLFIKPVRAGSSIGISMVSSKEALIPAIKYAAQFDTEITMEKAIQGVEVGCGIIGNEAPIIGGVDEIELDSGFFSFIEKYELISSQIHMPARISKKAKLQIQQAARKIYKAVHCEGLSRIDFFLQEDGQLVFNEVNTMPGFTEHSRFPALMREAGYSYEKLIQTLIELAEEKRGAADYETTKK
ncbi:D-alanine--D-alanine ligase [Listeria grandensis]|uniref:D-alanine--D-alanine ligase family protein n=1 Tax=Listeria grandensis TaxID=1494963 RepID=UPI001628C9C5|nr:D-alanine--D-alanine ligase family protein [Listeria grandensis]MBC1475494.1 D-alanine--D-alanine ligase [Listeria grandensis]